MVVIIAKFTCFDKRYQHRGTVGTARPSCSLFCEPLPMNAGTGFGPVEMMATANGTGRWIMEARLATL
jgi:hypothetical protein